VKDITRKLATLVGILFVAMALGCASTAKQEGTGEYMDDTVITTKVKAALLDEATLKVRRNQRRDLRGRGSAQRLCDLAGRRKQRG
jgi:hypothetical protein